MTSSYVTRSDRPSAPRSYRKPSALLLAALTLALIAPCASAAGARQDETKKQEAPQPITWGVMGQTPGCVIFSEGHKSSGRFGLTASNKNLSRLTVLEGENYTLDQKEYLETQENLDALMHRAEKDHIKYVKIPEKYSPELLVKARAACKQDQ